MSRRRTLPKERRLPKEKRPGFSVRLGRKRVDNARAFECRRCLQLTAAADGSAGGPDSVDPRGDLCSECWCHIEEFRRHPHIPKGRRYAAPGDAIWAAMLFKRTKYRGYVYGLSLDDGSRWSAVVRFGGRLDWVCTRGPQ